MKYKYTFSVLHYVHDVVSGEFVNIGLLFHCPEAGVVNLQFERRYSRISKFFGDSAGAEVANVVAGIASRLDETVGRTRMFPAKDALELANHLLASDSSSLQFSELRGGVCLDAEATARSLFERYVEKYVFTSTRPTRSDDDVLNTFKKALRERELVGQIRPRLIATKDYKHEFPLAWKNGIWHTAEAVSLDLISPDAIVDKANRWLGRGTNLREGEAFKLHFLIGAPSSTSPTVHEAFAHALRIMEKVPVDHELHREPDAASFADAVARDIATAH